jgi:DNA uptake protein ComE-like DNA-binding protein
MKHIYLLHKSDRKALLAIAIVALMALGILILTGTGQTNDNSRALGDTLHVATTHYRQATYAKQPLTFAQKEQKPEYFAFDPNTADSTQLLRLGLRPWQVVNIYKYRSKGGIYRKKEDFARLYGLTAKQYRELEPYIRISADYLPATTLVENQPTARDTTRRYPEKLKAGQQIDLATADTTALQRVPGIGRYFATRIVRLRQQLGGFAHIDQLDDIDNFPQTAKAYFSLDNKIIKKLNINSLSQKELQRHPYINYSMAKAIVDYRRLHGTIHTLRQLSLISDFTPEAIRRLEPYVEY